MDNVVSQIVGFYPWIEDVYTTIERSMKKKSALWTRRWLQSFLLRLEKFVVVEREESFKIPNWNSDAHIE